MKEFTALTADININKENFIQLINQQADKAIAALPPQRVDMGLVQVSKVGPLKLNVVGQEILLAIPLGIHFEGKRFLGLVEAQGAIELSFRTQVDFQPQWQLITETKLERYTWLDQPDVQLSILNFSVEKMADQFLGKNKDKIEREVDQAVRKFWTAAEVPAMAEAFFQKWHPLRPDLPLFLKITPQEIQLVPTTSDTNSFQSQLNSLLHLELRSNTSEQYASKPPTPSFAKEMTNSQSDIKVNVNLDYIDIEQILNSQLKGQSFSYKDNKVDFTSLKLKKTNDVLQINIGLSGYVDGEIKMDCLPVYDKSQNTITMQIQSFEMKADSFWKQSLVNLFSGRVRKEIEERLLYNLDDILKLKAVQQLYDFEAADNVNVSVIFHKIDLRDFIVGEIGFSCVLGAQIRLGLSFFFRAPTC